MTFEIKSWVSTDRENSQLAHFIYQYIKCRACLLMRTHGIAFEMSLLLLLLLSGVRLERKRPKKRQLQQQQQQQQQQAGAAGLG